MGTGPLQVVGLGCFQDLPTTGTMLVMRCLDHELKWCAGRTVREVLLICGGLGLVVREFVGTHSFDVGNLIVYVGATLLLMLRFFPARAVGVGACIGAIVQQWPHLRMGDVTVETLAVAPLVGIALLASRDLVERFERAPSRLAWLPNPWASFSAAETRTLRWAAYAAGALSGLLDHTLQNITPFADPLTAPWWPRIAMVVLIGALVLLCLGRAVGVLLVWLTTLVVVIIAAPLAWQAETVLDPQGAISLPWDYVYAARYFLPVTLLAAAAVVITTPAVVRLLRKL